MRRLRVLLACECSGRVRDEFAKRGWEAWSADILPSETPVQASFEPGDRRVPRLHGPERLGLKNNFHYQGNVRDLFDAAHPVNWERFREQQRVNLPLWDLVIAFPPCTDLSYAGNRWRAEKRADGREDAGAEFFMEMINAPSPMVAVENPRGVMFSRYRKPDQTIQPWWFGDPFKKSTCLWLKNLPLLVPEYDEAAYQAFATVTSGDMKGYRLHKTVTSGSTVANDPRHDFNGRAHYEDSEGRFNRAKVRSRTFEGIARAFAAQWGAFAENYYAGNALDMSSVRDGNGKDVVRREP
jgi:hypothetical protein